jgi:hypothetical protein
MKNPRPGWWTVSRKRNLVSDDACSIASAGNTRQGGAHSKLAVC